jgi:hypothetical protein
MHLTNGLSSAVGIVAMVTILFIPPVSLAYVWLETRARGRKPPWSLLVKPLLQFAVLVLVGGAVSALAGYFTSQLFYPMIGEISSVLIILLGVITGCYVERLMAAFWRRQEW